MTCRSCEAPTDAVGWCGACGRGERLRAHEWQALLLDSGAEELVSGSSGADDPLGWPGYRAARDEAPGEDAVRVWAGTVDGHGCVLIAFDFAHLGGSMGTGVAERVVTAFREAVHRRLPVVAVTATGGARMQEGMASLVGMGRTVGAAAQHAGAGLLQVAVLSDPTTGGVYASFATRGDLLFAEPGAYVGFAGPRVAKSLAGVDVAADVNRAEFAFRHGLCDALVARPELRATIARTLQAVAAPAPLAPPHPDEAPPARPSAGPWAQVQVARDRRRPGAGAFLEHFTDLVRCSGDRCGGVDEGVIAGLARLHGRPVGVVALNRRQVRPAGYRTAQRLFALAGRLGLPVVTIVDTPGADPGSDAEAAGQAAAISATFAALLAVPTPTVALVTGEGGSGGALAFAVTDCLVLQEGAFFSVIAPEGAAAILHRDTDRAAEVAELLQLTPDALHDLGIVDIVTSDEPKWALAEVAHRLDVLSAEPADARLRNRRHRYGAGDL